MKVLKFGGTSLGSAENINRVINILTDYSQKKSVICVVSAVGGITDKLLLAGKQAQNKDQDFLNTFSSIEALHYKIIKALNPDKNHTILAYAEDKLNQLKSLLEGIYLINELSPKTSDKLVSFGEALSSFILAETMKHRGLDTAHKNSQELIITNSDFTKAEVNFSITNANIQTYFNSVNQKITILPGFVAKSNLGEQTTLGRGGADLRRPLLQQL